MEKKMSALFFKISEQCASVTLFGIKQAVATDTAASTPMAS
jgi:hypothetical protein